MRRHARLRAWRVRGSSAQAGHRAKISGDAPHRRTASRTSVLGSRRMAFELRKRRGQPQAGVAADAGDGDRGSGSTPRHEQSRAQAQDIPLPAARPQDRRAEPRVGGRRDVHRDGGRLLIWWRSSTGPAARPGLAAVATMRASARRRASGPASVRYARIFITGLRALRRRGLRPALAAAGVAISMDGRGASWTAFSSTAVRAFKYAEVHLQAYADGRAARAGCFLDVFLHFRRPHQAMNNQTPMAVGAGVTAARAGSGFMAVATVCAPSPRGSCLAARLSARFRPAADRAASYAPCAR